MQELPPLICADGLVIEMRWAPTDTTWLSGKASGELELVATAGEEILGRDRRTLSVDAPRLEEEAMREARRFEKRLRASLQANSQ